MARKKKPKKHKCRVCKGEYEKKDSFQTWCSPLCGYKYSQKMIKKKEDEDRKERVRYLKKRKEKIKTKHDLTREAQEAFNRFVVQRDWGNPCICCNKHPQREDIIAGSPWHAGHYLSVGAHPEKRFDEDNVHKQRAYCNKNRQGDSGDYRKNLIEKIGLKRVLELESPRPQNKYTHDELREIRDRYRKEANRLKKLNKEKMQNEQTV